MAGFLDVLRTLGLYGNVAPAVPPQLAGIPPEIVQAARAQATTGIGSQLLAAGMARSPSQRAAALAGIADAGDMTRPIYNMAQAKLMATPKAPNPDTQVVQVDGRQVLIDKNTGEVIRDLGAAPAHGGSGGINITNMLPGDKKEFDTEGELAGKREDSLIQSADEAQTKLGKLGLIQSVLGNIEQGTFAEAKGQTVAALKALGANDQFIQSFTGLDPRLPEGQQIAQKMISELVIGSIGPGGFPANNFSDADRAFLQKSFPQLSGQPWANDLVVETLKRVEQFKIDKAADWDAYAAEHEANGERASYRIWERDFRKRMQGTNMFADLQAQVQQRLNGARTSPQPGAAPIGGSVNVNGKTIPYKVIQ